MRTATLYRVLLVLIALALIGNHAGTLRHVDLAPVAVLFAGAVAGLCIGVVAAIMGVAAGGELLIPTIALLFGTDIKVAGNLSLAV